MAYQNCDVLILTANYGSGHRQVARALSEAIGILEPSTSVTILDYFEFLDPFWEQCARIGYYKSIQHFPLGYQLYYHATNTMNSDSFLQRRLNRIGLPRFIDALQEIQPKIVIATFPIPAGVLSSLRGSGQLQVPVITVITDFVVHNSWIHPHTDLYLVASDEVAEGLYQRGVSPTKVVVTGIPILPSFCQPIDKLEARRCLGLDLERKTVLVMGGGDGIFGLDPLSLINGQTPAYQGIILTGKNRELYEKFRYLRDASPSWRTLGELSDALLPMCAADLLITKPGGITVSEALALGLPMVLAKPLPGQERVNARFLQRRHAALIARDSEQLQATIHRLLKDDLFRRLLAANSMRLRHPDSSYRGAEIVLQLMNQRHQRLSLVSGVRRNNRG